MQRPNSDPGWGDALKRVPAALVPTRGMRMAAGGTNGLTIMRLVWITFVASMLLIGVAVFAIDRALPGGGADGRVVAMVVAGLGVFAQVAAIRFVPAITGTTMPAVRATAQRAFFLRIAFAEPAALLGFLGFVLSGNAAVYVVGFVVGMAGMADAAPTASWIADGQKELQASGSDVELLAALVSGGITR
ncbi:MAG: hypothetical protein RIB98_12070 [Acidimicrobiales bacterium]